MTAAIDYESADLAILASLEERHFWFRARRRIILDALARWFPDAFPAWRIVASDALELRELVEAAGFEVLGHTSFNTLNLPLLALRSWLLQATGRCPQPIVPPAPANWLMERFMDADRLLIRAGFSLPAGGSLLLAARAREGT